MLPHEIWLETRFGRLSYGMTNCGPLGGILTLWKYPTSAPGTNDLPLMEE